MTEPLDHPLPVMYDDKAEEEAWWARVFRRRRMQDPAPPADQPTPGASTADGQAAPRDTDSQPRAQRRRGVRGGQ